MVEADERVIDEQAVVHDNGRGAERHPLAVQATLVVGEGLPRTYLTDDVSPQGLFLRTARPLRAGTRVRVEFALPKTPRFTVDAVVAWNTDDACSHSTNLTRRGMGLRFTHVPPPAGAIMARYFATHRRR